MSVTRMFPQQVLLLALLSLSANSVVGQGVDYHLGLGHNTGDSIGLDDGYSQFDAWLPVWQPSDSSVLFSDTRLLLYNEQTEALGANVGFGGRWVSPVSNRIWGTYLYYDYRDTGPAHFDQLSWGFENLGQKWDARANAYLPLENNSAQIGLRPRFSGGNVILDSITQQALRGWDAELGRVIYRNKWAQVRVLGGVYGFYGSNSDDAWGGRARIECRVKDQLWVGGYVQNDRLFDTTGGLQVSWRYGVRRHGACASACNLACRLGDPVYRQQHIAIAQQVLDTGAVATVGGNNLDILHVNSAAPGGGTGGIDDPVNNLAAASNQPENIVYVHGGSSFSGEAITISTAEQRLLAEGKSHTVFSDQGQFTLPTVNGGPAPVIDAAPGVAINIAADGVEVSGFEITNSGFSGIAGSNIDRFNINCNTITFAGISGVELVNINGTGSISDNGITMSTLDGINVAGNLTGDIVRNGTSVNGGSGIAVIGNLTGDLTDNSASRNGANGIRVSGDMVGDATGNAIFDSTDTGLQILGTLQGDLVNNTSISNDDAGIHVAGDVIGNVANNTANSNTNQGIVFGSNVNGNLSDNTANSNSDDGIEVQGNMVGNAVGNTVTGNGFEGLHIIGTLQGNLADNIASGNLTGIHVNGAVTGNVTNNDSSNSNSHGVSLDNGVTGVVSGNTTNDNSGDGLLIGSNILGDVTGNVSNGNTNRGFVFGTINGNFTNNTADGNTNTGFSLFGDMAGDVSGNLVSNNGNRGMSFVNNITGNVINNTVNGNGSTGIDISGNLIGNVENNAITNNQNIGFGLNIGGDMTGNITGNIVSGNDNEGVNLVGNLIGNVTNNVANGNNDEGFQLRGIVTGDIVGNITNGNGDSGIAISGPLNGSLLNNTANNSGVNSGIRVDFDDVNGDVIGNTTNGNAADGIFVGFDLNGNLVDNTANNNGDDGFDVDGAITGVISGNTTLGNGDLPIEN